MSEKVYWAEVRINIQMDVDDIVASNEEKAEEIVKERLKEYHRLDCITPPVNSTDEKLEIKVEIYEYDE